MKIFNKENWFKLAIVGVLLLIAFIVFMYFIGKNNIARKELSEKIAKEEMIRLGEKLANLNMKAQQEACISNVKGAFLTSFSAICKAQSQKGCDVADVEIAVSYGEYIFALNPNSPFARLSTIYKKNIETCKNEN